MFLKGTGGAIATSLRGSSTVVAQEGPDGPYEFDVSKLPNSIGYLEDPNGRQQEAWNVARDIYEFEQSASDALAQYSTEDIDAVLGTASAARADLRSFSRLVEVLHERDLAGVIDESLLNSIGKRADIVVRYAPLFGSVNNVLRKAEAFATAISGPTEFVDELSQEQRTKYMEFVLSIACLCLETGLMWVGVPFKLAWEGTRKVFFARGGTLFRLGRYGGDRFVAFFMSEVHWEIREALFEDVVTTERAKWVTDQVNEAKEVPQFTELRDDAESLVDDHSDFDVADFEGYDFATKQAGNAADAGLDIVGEAVELVPEDIGDTSSSEESLVLQSTMEWDDDGEQDVGGFFPGF